VCSTFRESDPGKRCYTGGMIAIVPLDLHDRAHAAALLELLDHYAQEPTGGGKPISATVRAELIPALKQETHYLGLVALDGARPVGLANCFFGFSTFAARPLLNIHDLVVHRDAGRAGRARRLLDAAADAARARGCCKLTLEVLSENQPALAAYAAAGFERFMLEPASGHALFLQKKLVPLTT
jgi:ribosomal protein S18 acetylase RimI-like enzyme